MKKLCRLIAPKWLLEKDPSAKRTIEGEFDENTIRDFNRVGYSVFSWPNSPSRLPEGHPVSGPDIDRFNYIFVDYDTKSGVYDSKDAFIEAACSIGLIPSKVVDSGNGVHVYWAISDLDAMSYLRLQRRLIRTLKTDEATSSIAQLMRLPGTMNTKKEDAFIPCELLFEDDGKYTCEELDKILDTITQEDEQFCQNHYNKTYNLNRKEISIKDILPPKFGKLLLKNQEVKELFVGAAEDRSKNDFRLGHLLFANGFTKEEATSVLVNSAKALTRAPVHRASYATNIIDKIWTFEINPDEAVPLSSSVADILSKKGSTIKGTPFRCHPRIDNTVHGFRLGQVIGLVAGSGVGKTAFAMNMFLWFTQQNPEYHHFFIPLEQPGNEIADRWQTMCGQDTSLHNKVHVLSNYDDDGNFRHLSLEEIKTYILDWKKKTGNEVGCIVIDHIGALKKKGAKDERQDLITICHSMKAFAVQTNTLLVMQSQSSREKAGIGDLELNKDAAYGTIFFEAYCDYLLTLWQPLKRCHSEESCPTVTAFKFCKIRHKKTRKDVIQEDVPYFFYFDSDTELLRDMTQTEKRQFDFFLSKSTNKRTADRKTELVSYQSVPYESQDKQEVRKGMH